MDDLALNALVIPFLMIVGDVFVDDVAKCSFAEEDHLIQAFVFDRFYESLGERVEIGRSFRKLNVIDSGIGEDLVELGREEGIAVMNEETVILEESVKAISQVTSDLLHPWTFALLCNARDVNFSSCESDDQKHVIADDSFECEDLYGEEIGGSENVPMTF